MKSTFLLLFLITIGFWSPVLSQSDPGKNANDPPLRVSELTDAIVADLQKYVPEYLAEKRVPGAAIALVQNGRVVWTCGFGVTNSITRQPVQPEAIFELASNSKVVTAYLALRMVDQCLLSLDRPLNQYLKEPWLPPSPYRDVISLRHVLSHSAGLKHNTPDRHSQFAPGKGYAYSAIGFLYLQAVIEAVSGKSLEQNAREWVFAPLGMTSSSFESPGTLQKRAVNGHLRALVPVLLFAVGMIGVLLALVMIGLPIVRLISGHWRSGRQLVRAGWILAVIGSISLLFLILKSSLAEFAWLIAFTGLFVALIFLLFYFAGRILMNGLPVRRAKALLALVWGILVGIGILWVSSKIANVPVPRWPPVSANAAASLRAPAADLAKFALELARPQLLSDSLAQELRTPQVKLADDLYWGLGPGIQRSPDGDALWQWGQHLDFQSLMIIYPEHGFGVVVCTNNDLLQPQTAIDIAHRALGGRIDLIRQASRLAFNYRVPKGSVVDE